MDNIFEILIYVIIIISFLSSIFKKKKQQQQKPPIRQSQTDEYNQAEVVSPQTQKKEDYDILRELEDFFKVGEEPTRQQIPVPIPPEKPKIPNMDEHVRTDSWHAKTESEHYVDEWERKKSEVKKIISSVDSSIEKKAALFEASLDKKDATISSIALAVKSKMKNPSTLKEYIIFSEILGKPKALRR
ncbi:MAG: hypothetical protein OQJ78_07930 [Ignavibacteriaceae bacterium]|jgi:hypothetical protein|nr:hypothetical protein [Ignavibacteriaceae bacterium]